MVRNYVTPRHFLDFISHIASLIETKRAALRLRESHVSVGLQKLSETSGLPCFIVFDGLVLICSGGVGLAVSPSRKDRRVEQEESSGNC